MIDTHCHLWFKHFEGEIPEVVERAEKAGVSKMLCAGVDEKSSRRCVELAKEYESVYAAVGLHPTDSNKWDEDKSIVWMKVLIELNKGHVVAVGETGLDYYHEPYDADLQKIMFREQCLLAQEFDLPIIVHLRNSKQSTINKQLSSGEEHFSMDPVELDCLHVLEEVDMKPKKVIFHCFSGGHLLAEAVLERGWYISFAGPLTYPKAEESREVAKIVPLEQLLVETDSPFLPPQKHRGKRNEPSYVVDVAKELAELKGVSYEDLEKQLAKNWGDLLGR